MNFHSRFGIWKDGVKNLSIQEQSDISESRAKCFDEVTLRL